MNIAVLVIRLDSGGVEKVTERLISGFLEEGHSVDLLTTTKLTDIPPGLPSGANIVNIAGKVRLPGIPGLVSPRVWLGLTSLRPLANYLRRTPPDVLLATQSGLTAVAGRILARSKTRVVLRVAISQRASIEKDPYRIAKLLPFTRKFTFKRANHVITNSIDVADEIENSAGIPRSKITVIRNPSADPEILTQSRIKIDHPWLDDQSVPTAIAVGRLSIQKDYPTLLKAHAIVSESTACKLVIVGEGEDRKTLMALTEKLGTSADVDFIGYSNNPWSYMSRASVYLLTSAWEGSPSSLIEAMTLGIPSIATDSPGGTSEVLDQGKFGILKAVGDFNGIAEAWLEVLQNPELAKQRVDSGISESENYTPNIVVARYLEVLSSET
jgi:glycosyltransferase involved in cell wall biosynthesis